VMARTIVRDLHGHEQGARLMARMLVVFSVIPIAAPLAGALMLALGGWRAVFWLLGGVAALLAAAVALRFGETVPSERISAHPAQIARSFAAIAAEPKFLAPFAAMLCAQIGIFAFVSNSAFSLVDGLGVAPGAFALLFAVVMVGQIVGAWLSSRLVMRWGMSRLLRTGTLLAFLSGLAAALCAWAGASHPVSVVLPFMGFLFASALIIPNATSLALQPFARTAGTASSLMGATQFAMGAVVSSALGALFDGTPRPMASAAALAGLGAFLVERRFLRGPR
jgi:DHA1 family bicyclomycin/chloramphenicol resistance-like MFS transporter